VEFFNTKVSDTSNNHCTLKSQNGDTYRCLINLVKEDNGMLLTSFNCIARPPLRFFCGAMNLNTIMRNILNGGNLMLRVILDH
jgi:hypothetical protein